MWLSIVALAAVLTRIPENWGEVLLEIPNIFDTGVGYNLRNSHAKTVV